MAEIVYKKISELDNATVPLTGTELIGVSATGVSKKATIEGIHGAGWWTKLKAAFVDFVSPEALHADDSDTCGEEAPADFHDATQLTGNIHLDRIPATLTGKTASACSGNSATATNAENADTVDGVHVITAPGDGLHAKHGSSDFLTNATEAQIYTLLSSVVPNVGDVRSINFIGTNAPGTSKLWINKLSRYDSDTLILGGIAMNSSLDMGETSYAIDSGDTTIRFAVCFITW
jgi:hypothetical protein